VMLQPGADGLRVAGVVPGSAAEKAGMEKGDRILAVNGKAPGDHGMDGLSRIFGRPEPIKLVIDREGNTVEVTVTPAAE
jgi:regulator of sigma E protease